MIMKKSSFSSAFNHVALLIVVIKDSADYSFFVLFCLFVLEFYGPVNNEVMSSRSVNTGTVPGQAQTF